jgi:glycosyltransferase involved in cell wall biosynthesis
MEWPDLEILVCTYNRVDDLTKTLTALHANLQYAGKLHYVVCDDSSPGGYLAKLKKRAIWKALDPEFITTDRNSGWAANVNNGNRRVFYDDDFDGLESEFVFFIEDDYVLTRPLDLSLGIAIMKARPDLGMLRYRGTAGDQLVYHQTEAVLDGILPDYQQGLGLPGRVNYLQIDSGSPSLYIYSHGAHLKRGEFHSFYGEYPEGLKLGETEETYAHMVKDGMKEPGAPGIAILPDWIPMWFDHIGQSYQHTEADK